jgi:hypothetical protein
MWSVRRREEGAGRERVLPSDCAISFRASLAGRTRSAHSSSRWNIDGKLVTEISCALQPEKC